LQLQPARHFLFLIDGTGLNAGKIHGPHSYSNVYNLNIAIETHNDDYSANIAFYFSGVGSSKSSSLGDRAAGIGLSDLIEQVYVNICSNFNGGDAISVSDKIYLFGFSRGAFVVQAVCRLIDEYGLLTASRVYYFNEMYRHWLGRNPELKKENFVNQYCRRNIQVEFVGIFDSVFGFYNEDRDSPLLKSVMDKNKMLPSAVKCGSHFIAIDEARRFFHPFPWEGISNGTQELIQIWMPGNHTDVGGGYQEDFLSSISLRQMLELISTKTTLKIDEDRLTSLNHKIKRESEEYNKICVHSERSTHTEKITARLKAISRPSSQNWPRSEYVTDKHFVSSSAKYLDGRYIMRGKTRSQYIVPDDLDLLQII
jgi:uncharacterized protein (DUF2235 family)